MQKLVNGIRKFQKETFHERQTLFEALKSGQQPEALFITCSDSRIDPNLLTQTEPGDLFVLRTAGNIVPPYEAAQDCEAGTIEYAVSVLKIPDVIVCGHSQCGAMAGLLHPEGVASLPAVQALLKHAEDTGRLLQEKYGDLSDEAARLATAVEQNVLMQLEHLKTHPSVSAALERGELNLHGWVYKFETGEVFAYDPDKQQFLPLEETASP